MINTGALNSQVLLLWLGCYLAMQLTWLRSIVPVNNSVRKGVAQMAGLMDDRRTDGLILLSSSHLSVWRIWRPGWGEHSFKGMSVDELHPSFSVLGGGGGGVVEQRPWMRPLCREYSLCFRSDRAACTNMLLFSIICSTASFRVTAVTVLTCSWKSDPTCYGSFSR